MFKQIIGAFSLILLVTTGAAHAGTIEWQQPYFAYSPGAQDFEAFEWTPLEFAAFSAYGGYFANIRRPRFETPLPELFIEPVDFGLEDEVKMAVNVGGVPTFLPQHAAFSAYSATSVDLDEEQGDPVPEPGLLALIGGGLLAGSRLLRRRRPAR